MGERWRPSSPEYQKAKIEQPAYRVARQIHAGERAVVGVNGFLADDHEPCEPLRGDPAIERAQSERLARLRHDRDAPAVEAAMSAPISAARGSDNVLVPLKRALSLGATVGEVCVALRQVWGSYVPAESL